MSILTKDWAFFTENTSTQELSLLYFHAHRRWLLNLHQKQILISLKKRKSLQLMLNQELSSITTLNLCSDQVSGKDPKFTTSDGSKILKNYNEAEQRFYTAINSLHLSHTTSAIRKYMPAFYNSFELINDPTEIQLDQSQGESTKQWLSHLSARYKERISTNKFIVLQNFTAGYKKTCIFDIKIGGRNEEKKHKITQSVANYCVKLNGCRISYPEDGKATFLSKYYLQKKTDIDSITTYIALFFYNGHNLLIDSILKIKQRLSQLILSFKSLLGYKFISTSVCFIYDACDSSKADIKLIDFGRIAEMQPSYFDYLSCIGLQNLYMFLSHIIETKDKLVPELSKMKQYYLENSITLIPSHKKMNKDPLNPSSPVKSTENDKQI